MKEMLKKIIKSNRMFLLGKTYPVMSKLQTNVKKIK